MHYALKFSINQFKECSSYGYWNLSSDSFIVAREMPYLIMLLDAQLN